MKLDQARKLKGLEKENARLKRAVAELTLDKQILQEAVVSRRWLEFEGGVIS